MQKCILISIWIILIACLSISCFSCITSLSGSTVHFASEQVTLRVYEQDDDLFLDVEGYFYFENSGSYDLTLPIQFPIPSDTGMLQAESVRVAAVSAPSSDEWESAPGYAPVPFMIIPPGDAFSYRFKFPGNQTSIMLCRYTQKLKGNKLGYIVRSTQSWGKPLNEAHFRIILPEGYQLVDSNYDFVEWICDEVEDSSEIIFWKYDTVNFLPDKDIYATFGKTFTQTAE